MGLDITGVRLVAEGQTAYLSALKSAQDATRGLGTAAAAASGGMESLSSGGMIKAVAIGNVLGNMFQQAVGAIWNFSTGAIESASKMQDVQLQLENLTAAELVQTGVTQDMGQAIQMAGPIALDTMDKLKKLALASPFEYNQILQAYMLQKQFGQTSETAMDLTRAITNLGAANKSIPDVVGRVSYSFGQMTMMGRIGGQEMRELAMAGVDLGKMLQEKFGKSVEQVNQDLQSGKMTMADVSKAFVEYVDRYFGEAAARASRSFSGLQSSFNDLINLSSIDIFGGMLNVVTENLGALFDKAQQFIQGGGLLPIGAGLEVVTQSLFNLGATAASAGQNFFDQFGQKMLDTASAALDWGANIVIQLASGIIQGAGAALTEAMNVISSMLAWFLAPGSPPRVAQDLPKWGTNAIQQFLKGFTDADYSVLDSVGSALQSALSAMVGAGTIDQGKSSSIFQSIQSQIAKVLATGGDLTPVLDSIKKELGEYGGAVAELATQQFALGKAMEQVEKAEKALQAAREAEEKANQDVNTSLDDYNELVRAGASPEVLAAKRAEFEAAKQRREEAKKAGTQAEKDLENAKKEAEELKKKVELQEKLVQELIELTKKQKEAEKDPKKGPGGGAGKGGMKMPPVKPPDMSKASEAIQKKVEEIKKNLSEKLSTMFDPIKQAWDKTVEPLKEAWDNFSQRIKEAYDQFIKPVVDEIGKMIPPDLVQNIGYAAGAVGVLALAFGALSIVGGIIAGILGAINWPLLLIIGIVALLKTAWDNNWFGMRDTLMAFWPTVKGVIDQVGEIVGKVIGSVIEWFQENKDVIMGVVITAWRVLGAIVKAVIAALLPIFKNLWTSITTAFKNMGPLITQFQNLWSNLWQILQPILVALGAILVMVLTMVVGTIGGIASALGPLITMIVNVVTGIVTTISGVVQVLAGVMNLIVGLFTGNGEKIKQAWQQIKDGIGNIIAGMKQQVISLITGMIDTVLAFFSGFFTSAVQFFKNLYEELVGHSIIPDLVNGIIEWIGSLPGKAAELFTAMVERAKQILNDAVEAFKTIGSNIIQGIIDGVNSAKDKLINMLIQLAQDALAAAKKILGISSPSSVFASLVGGPIVDGIVQGILGKAKDVMAAIGDLFNFGKDQGSDQAVKAAADAITGSLVPAMTAASTYLSTIFMPALTMLGTYLTTLLIPQFTALGTYLTVTLLLALTTLATAWGITLLTAFTANWTFLTESLHPAYLALGTYLVEVLQPATDAFIAAWGVGMLTAFTNNFTYLTENLHPELISLEEFITKKFTPAISKVAYEVFPEWSDALFTLSDALAQVADQIKRVAAALKGLEIPDWATPGSPTPFEMGLRGMTSAMKELENKGVGTLAGGLKGLDQGAEATRGLAADATAGRLGLAAAAAGGGTSVEKNYNLTMNTRMEPETVRQGFDYFRLLGV